VNGGKSEISELNKFGSPLALVVYATSFHDSMSSMDLCCLSFTFYRLVDIGETSSHERCGAAKPATAEPCTKLFDLAVPPSASSIRLTPSCQRSRPYTSQGYVLAVSDRCAGSFGCY
jgi:hypothetical protein